MESIHLFTIEVSSSESSVLSPCLSAISAALGIKTNFQEVSSGAVELIEIRPKAYQLNYLHSRGDISSEAIQLWAQQSIQTSMIHAAIGLGWQALSLRPCPFRVVSVLALVHARRLLRRAVTPLTSGVRVRFALPNGLGAFALVLGGPFAIPTRLRRGEVFGQVTKLESASGYAALSICDACDGPRKIILPAHLVYKPTVGDCIYASLRPIRGSRLVWQVNGWRLVQPDLFPDALKSVAREQYGCS